MNWKKSVDELNQQRIDLEKEINDLNLLKNEKLKSINDELEIKIEWMDKERIKAIKERDNLLRKVRHSNEKKLEECPENGWYSGISGSGVNTSHNHPAVHTTAMDIRIPGPGHLSGYDAHCKLHVGNITL